MVGSLRGGGRSGGQGGVFGLAQQGADARQRFGLGGFVQRDLVVHGAAGSRSKAARASLAE